MGSFVEPLAATSVNSSAIATDTAPDANARIRILLADDHAVLRSGTRRILEDEPDLAVVAEASDGREAVTLAAQTHPDVVLMDITMPNMDGIAASSEIQRVAPGARLLILTAHASPAYVRAFQRLGATGYLLKSAAASELIAAIRRVYAGHYVYDLSLMERATSGPALTVDPTPRELQVLRELAHGATNRDIATTLGLSENTVEFHLRNVYDKLGVATRADAIAKARDHKLLDSE